MVNFTSPTTPPNGGNTVNSDNPSIVNNEIVVKGKTALIKDLKEWNFKKIILDLKENGQAVSIEITADNNNCRFNKKAELFTIKTCSNVIEILEITVVQNEFQIVKLQGIKF